MKRRGRLGRLAALAVLLLFCGCGGKKDGAQTAPSSRAAEAGGREMENGAAESAAFLSSADDKTPAENEKFPVGQKGDDYILPAAQSHVYLEERLSELTGEELRLARNEVYARHGRKFKSKDLAAYFSGKTWYQPSVEADWFDDSVLNQTEKDNLELIQRLEERIAAGNLSCPIMGKEEFPKIDGSTATLPLSQAIYRLLTGASLQEAEAEIVHWKTTQAYLNLIEDRGPKLVIAYEPGEQVKRVLSEKGDNLIIKPIGRDALVFLANSRNPVDSLTQEQVTDIYSGRLTNWKTAGGPDQRIKAFQRPENSGSQNLMEKLVMKNTPMAKAPKEYVYSNMEGILEGLASYDNTGEALGYSVYFYARNMYQKPELKFMAIDGVKPSNETIRDKSYPYVNDFYAAIRKDEPKDSRACEIFQWLTSDDGQALINGLGYVGLKDVKKSLPAVLEQEEKFSAEIPLKKGEVIVGKGEYLYGERGIAIFDRQMKLKRFISHAAFSEADPFLVQREADPLPLMDTQSGKFGLYSLQESRWICDPQYADIRKRGDGFELVNSQWVESESASEGKWQCVYDYANRTGRIIKKGVTRDHVEQEKEEDQSTAYDVQGFLEKYQEILKQYHAGADDLEGFFSEYQVIFCVNEKGGKAHFYNQKGRFLFDFDKSKEEAGAGYYPFEADGGISYLDVYSSGGTIKSVYVYRDGALFKVFHEDGGEDSYLSYIGDKFYARSVGNYVYVYNYEDEPCAKFLKGNLWE